MSCCVLLPKSIRYSGGCRVRGLTRSYYLSHLKRVIRQNHPGIEIESIPGVGVVPALASRFDAALEKSFEVSDGSEVESVIRIKATRPRKLAEELRQKGYDEFVLGTRLCTPEEKIIRGEMPERSDYFSVLLARRRK